MIAEAIQDHLDTELDRLWPDLLVSSLVRGAGIYIMPEYDINPRVNINLQPDFVAWRGYHWLPQHLPNRRGGSTAQVVMAYSDPRLITRLTRMTVRWFQRNMVHYRPDTARFSRR